jgi:hypothetical protein
MALFEMIAILSVVGFLTLGTVTIFRELFAYLRRGKAMRAQAELVSKVLEKAGDRDGLFEYLSSVHLSSGLGDPDEKPRSRPAFPQARILNAVQLGVVAAVMGIGFLVLRQTLGVAEAQVPLQVLGSVALFAGIALLGSAVAAWFLSRRLGLV